MHLTIWQTIFLALLQGITELFPISSLGHTVILPGLLGWGDLVRDPRFLPLIVALHLGTCIALLLYFWRDWVQVVRTLITSVKEGEVCRGTQEWVSWLILIGCIPAGLLGVFLEKPLKELFASPLIAATFLVVNGVLLFTGEQLRRHAESKWRDLPPKEREAQFRPLASLTWKQAILVGLFQSLALVPGISRSGATIVGGLCYIERGCTVQCAFLYSLYSIFETHLYDGIEFKEEGLSINLVFLERLRFMKQGWLLGSFALMIVALLAACGGTPYNAAGYQRVQVRLSEYKIDTSLTSFIPGKPYHFIITNTGQTTHELMIMPKAEGSMRSMSMGDKMSLAQVEKISPGETKTLDYTFPSSTAGSHPQFACYYPGHYEAGMEQDVIVHT